MTTALKQIEPNKLQKEHLNTLSKMRVCIQSLGAYNNGILKFKWIPIYDPLDSSLTDRVEALNKKWYEEDPHWGDEVMCADTDNIPYGFDVGEYPDYDRIEAVGKCIAKQIDSAFFGNEDPVSITSGYIEHYGFANINAENLYNEIEDTFEGSYDSIEEFGKEQARLFLHELSPTSFDFLHDYFDYENYANDLLKTYNFAIEHNYVLYIFLLRDEVTLGRTE